MGNCLRPEAPDVPTRKASKKDEKSDRGDRADQRERVMVGRKYNDDSWLEKKGKMQDIKEVKEVVKPHDDDNKNNRNADKKDTGVVVQIDGKDKSQVTGGSNRNIKINDTRNNLKSIA